MSRLTKSPISDDDIFYPESDGKPMADSTKQYEWIVTIKENLEELLPDDFVAADLFWYPVKGNPKIVQAPDVMIAIGRPKGHRRSYLQWQEDNIIPQVVFEILSHNNSEIEMKRKLAFYDRYGVQEYYVYDPDHFRFWQYLRKEDHLHPVSDQSFNDCSFWISPILAIRFELRLQDFAIYFANGDRFLTANEMRLEKAQARLHMDQERSRANQEQQRADQEQQRADQEQQRADREQQRADQEEQRAQKLADKLRALGIDPDNL